MEDNKQELAYQKYNMVELFSKVVEVSPDKDLNVLQNELDYIIYNRCKKGNLPLP